MAFKSSSRLSRSPPPENICKACDVPTTVSDMLTCSLCKRLKHYICNGLAETSFRKMSSENKGKWKCRSCKQSAPSSAEMNPQMKKNLFLENKVDDLEEVKRWMSEFQSDMKKHFDKKTSEVTNELIEVKKQLTEVSKAIDYFSSKYDDFFRELTEVKSVCQAQENEIIRLKEKMIHMEKKVEESDFEHKRRNLVALGVPEKINEDRNLLVETVAAAIGMDNFNSQTEIKEVIRLGALKSGTQRQPRPLLIKFTRQITRDECLNKFRQLAREDKRGPGLETNVLSENWSGSRWNMSEHLPTKTRLLLISARKTAQEKNFKYVWQKNGRIFLRKNDGDTPVWINSDEDLSSL